MQPDASTPRIFSTCPPSSSAEPGRYRQRVAEVARWSEEAGCEGMLIYTDNGLADPWLVAQVALQSTDRLAPLVAVQPIYLHPFSAAKMVSSLALLHGRRLHLNMVAGGFRNDLTSLGDPTEHDRRYDRLVEYTRTMQRLFDGGSPVSAEGEFYRLDSVRLAPPLPEELRPDFFISGSSEAGRAAAGQTGAVSVEYPQPADACAPAPASGRRGVRIGIIARDDAEEAWRVAHDRFPPDRRGQLTHQVAMKVSDSAWHAQLSHLARDSAAHATPYWLVPFQNYKTFCPYLVGSDEEVAEEVGRYLAAGYDSFILDVPVDEADLAHSRRVFERATARALS